MITARYRLPVIKTPGFSSVSSPLLLTIIVADLSFLLFLDIHFVRCFLPIDAVVVSIFVLLEKKKEEEEEQDLKEATRVDDETMDNIKYVVCNRLSASCASLDSFDRVTMCVCVLCVCVLSRVCFFIGAFPTNILLLQKQV